MLSLVGLHVDADRADEHQALCIIHQGLGVRISPVIRVDVHADLLPEVSRRHGLGAFSGLPHAVVGRGHRFPRSRGGAFTPYLVSRTGPVLGLDGLASPVTRDAAPTRSSSRTFAYGAIFVSLCLVFAFVILRPGGVLRPVSA